MRRTSILIRGVITNRELLFEHVRFFTVGASDTNTVDVLDVLTPLDFDSSLLKVRVSNVSEKIPKALKSTQGYKNFLCL